MRFILAGDLAGAWEDFGGLTAQINRLATALDLSITDHAGIAITYDHRIHVLIQKAALKRSTNTDYYNLLSSLHAETKAVVVRDFETQTELIKKEKDKAAKEKERGRNRRTRRRPGRNVRRKGRRAIQEVAHGGKNHGRRRIGRPGIRRRKKRTNRTQQGKRRKRTKN